MSAPVAMSSMALPTPEDMDKLTYRYAEELRNEMSRQDGQPSQLDFAPNPSCFRCKSPIFGKCHAAEWKSGYMTHAQRHMDKAPLVQAILKQFPWGRIEKDGTFADQFICAYFGVLGHVGFGYWSIAGGNVPHIPSSGAIGPMDTSPIRVGPQDGYQHGYPLLLDKHFDDKEGWKLEDRLIPKLRFDPGAEPVIASSVKVVDWKSWYQWRNLPLDSPAALLMHYPLSVYQLLVHVLHVTHPARNSALSRQALSVHYLGPEVELNMVPLFAELALLLPYTDIKLTMYGPAVHSVVKQAKRGSLAMKSKRGEAVFIYTSPHSMGASTIAIHLHGEHENWDPRLPSMTDDHPDAIVAANAGLLSYNGWQGVIIYSHVEHTPFAVTEYAEQSAEVHVDAIPQILAHYAAYLGGKMSTAALSELMSPRSYPIEFNPFQRPGQRYLGCTRVPNVPNGFTIKIFGRDIDQAKGEVPLPQERSVTASVDVSEEVKSLTEKAKGMSLDGLD
ncbi:hypothetical protein ID866_1516 [Astraeus odoratus]|nr:hypothetical protein ID866_1516 [Astraeus odoratus]